ncbi:hypothetical protein HDE_12849 [Halotydeus destructor]|nr:hypothetical protein HDE_12849 [Halotydeus destructor]
MKYFAALVIVALISVSKAQDLAAWCQAPITDADEQKFKCTMENQDPKMLQIMGDCLKQAGIPPPTGFKDTKAMACGNPAKGLALKGCIQEGATKANFDAMADAKKVAELSFVMYFNRFTASTQLSVYKTLYLENWSSVSTMMKRYIVIFSLTISLIAVIYGQEKSPREISNWCETAITEADEKQFNCTIVHQDPKIRDIMEGCFTEFSVQMPTNFRDLKTVVCSDKTKAMTVEKCIKDGTVKMSIDWLAEASKLAEPKIQEMKEECLAKSSLIPPISAQDLKDMVCTKNETQSLGYIDAQACLLESSKAINISLKEDYEKIRKICLLS